MDSEGFDLLAIAHNLDDSIETIFLNIARGTGLKGLSGIPVRNGRIIRPLMGVSRARIREYVESNGVSYRDDRTNFESHYARNRVRNIIFLSFARSIPLFSTLSAAMPSTSGRPRISSTGSMQESAPGCAVLPGTGCLP